MVFIIGRSPTSFFFFTFIFSCRESTPMHQEIFNIKYVHRNGELKSSADTRSILLRLSSEKKSVTGEQSLPSRQHFDFDERWASPGSTTFCLLLENSNEAAFTQIDIRWWKYLSTASHAVQCRFENFRWQFAWITHRHSTVTLRWTSCCTELKIFSSFTKRAFVHFIQLKRWLIRELIFLNRNLVCLCSWKQHSVSIRLKCIKYTYYQNFQINRKCFKDSNGSKTTDLIAWQQIVRQTIQYGNRSNEIQDESHTYTYETGDGVNLISEPTTAKCDLWIELKLAESLIADTTCEAVKLSHQLDRVCCRQMALAQKC